MLSPHILTATTLAALLLATPAMAVYKCKTANGSTTYQATPCANGTGTQIDTRPAASYSQEPKNTEEKTGSNTGTASGNSYQKKDGPFNAKWRRMNFLRNQGVRDANTNLNIHNNDCRIKMEQNCASCRPRTRKAAPPQPPTEAVFLCTSPYHVST